MPHYLPVDVTIHVTYWVDLNYNNESEEHNYTITKKFTSYEEFKSEIADILDDESEMLYDSVPKYEAVDYKLQVEFSPYSDGFFTKTDDVEPEVTNPFKDPNAVLKPMFDD